MRGALLLAAVAAVTPPASARAGSDDTELDRATIVYARGGSLYQSDGRGKGETELVALPAGTTGASVRALSTNSRGTVLLADVGGRWYWMRLGGGAAALAELPCGEGPAHLDTDATCVVCRSKRASSASVIVSLATGKATQVPARDAYVVGSGNARRLVWTDVGGVWSAPPTRPSNKTRVAPEAPLRGFLPSPDGTHATGTYADFVYQGKTKKPADVLMTFALDGEGARRKGIRTGVPIAWSHDNQWVLVQDGASACLMRAHGGQYKCWRGFTAVSIAPDGSYALVLGNRDHSRSHAPATPTVDVPVPLPSEPQSLFRAMIATPYDATPTVIATVVDGAAVWVPGH